MFALSRKSSGSRRRLCEGLRRCRGNASHDDRKCVPEEFGRVRLGSFFQEQPTISNPFTSDNFLQRCLRALLPEHVWTAVSEDLTSFGERICAEIDLLGRNAELNPPRLRQFDAWGNRVDDIITSQAWKDLCSITAEEGLVALGYERKHQQWSRLYQMAKLYLFAPSSGLYSCPIAMTDGAAKILESSKDIFPKEEAFSRLTTRNPDHFWSSGQWMTERPGGSDVGGGTSTIARGPFSNGSYKLYGYKWFSSAADAQMAFTLARIVDEEGLITKGTEGVSLFYVETRNEKGHLNNLEIQHLKNKLGTRQLPTAEMLLDGTEAYMLGEPGCGIRNISPMLNITRLHNSVAAVGNMRRMVQLCADYSTKRLAFGKYLYQHPLHMQTLSRMEVQTRGCMVFLLEVCRLLGLSECGLSSPSEKSLLRILTPLLKLYTAKQAVLVASEGLEAFGGQGYIEDTGLPTLLRDAQVLPIWEGTTNILSSDVVRVLAKFGEEVSKSITDVVLSYLADSVKDKDMNLKAEVIKGQLNNLLTFIEKSLHEDVTVLHTAARDISFTLAHIYIASLLINYATKEHSTDCDKEVALRWCRQTITDLGNFKSYAKNELNKDIDLVLYGK